MRSGTSRRRGCTSSGTGSSSRPPRPGRRTWGGWGSSPAKAGATRCWSSSRITACTRRPSIPPTGRTPPATGKRVSGLDRRYLKSMAVSTENAAAEIQLWLRDNVTGGREVPPDEPLIENGVLTSLQAVELVTFLEERFDILVEDEEFDEENFGSVEAIASLVASKTA